jgi:outer membrane protein assembly factor BamB
MIAQSRSPVPGSHVVDGASVLVGGDRLSAFDIQTAREQLNRRWSLNESETFIAPLLKVGSAIVHTRRRRGSLGITVSASRIDNGAMIWRTDIASPTPVLTYDTARNQIVAVTSLGDVYRLAPEPGIVDKPNEVMEVDGAEVAYSFGDATPLADGRIVMTNQRDRAQILLLNAQMETNSARTIRMDVGDATVNTTPVALGNAVVMALDSGQVHLFSPETGKGVALPFQPALEPGAKALWRAPVAVGNQFVITDGTKRIFRVGIKEQPQPHLDQVAAGALPAELLGSIAVAGDTVYGAMRRDSNDIVQAFALNDLSVGMEIPLSGRLQAGPWTVGGTALLVSSKEGLICLDAGQQKRWQSPMPYGELAGPPQIDGETVVLTSRSGTIWRVGLRDGAEAGKLEMGDPLLSSAVVTSAGILVTTSDGTLMAVRIPNSGEGAAGAGQ